MVASTLVSVTEAIVHSSFFFLVLASKTSLVHTGSLSVRENDYGIYETLTITENSFYWRLARWMKEISMLKSEQSCFQASLS